VHDSDTLIPTSNNTAISLWHKFATWQNEMDQCRKMVRTICDEQDKIRTQMKDLLAIREEERRKIKAMEQEDSSTNALSDKPSLELLRALQCKLDDVEEHYRTAAASLEATKQNDQNQTSIRQEILRDFINASRGFHLKCQHVQYDLMESAIAVTQNAEHIVADSNETVGMLCRVHTLHAALCAKPVEDTSNSNTMYGVDESWISKTIEDLQSCSSLHKATMIDYQESSDENDPSTWKVCKAKDFELHRAVELYTQQRKKYDIAAKELEQLQSKYDTLHAKGLDRDRRMMKLQTQLQRIQNDCTTIESEIDQCTQLTLEDEALAHTYRCSKCACVLFLSFPSIHLPLSHHFKF
jgi:chromosome segregation ATPase